MSSFVTRLGVRSYELDSFGHVNHANYLNYFELARFEAFDRCGLGVSGLMARGWSIHVVRVEVDYRSESFLGDELEVHTRIGAWGRTSTTLEQRIVKAADPGKAVAEGRVVIVWIGEDRRPMRIPPEARAALEGHRSNVDGPGRVGQSSGED